MMASSIATAHSIRTPEGNMPMVHWAVLESTPGNLEAMGKIGANTVAPQTAKESGTYALYGAVDVNNHDVMRLLENMASAKSKEFQNKISSMFLNSAKIENLPANIPMSTKGLQR